MKPMISAVTPTTVKLVIARRGRVCDILEATSSGNGGLDPLNNSPSGTENWGVVGSTLCARLYPGRNNEQVSGPSGEFDRDEPVLAVPADSGLSDGHRVDYGGTIYEVGSRTDFDHYVEWTARIVEEPDV